MQGCRPHTPRAVEPGQNTALILAVTIVIDMQTHSGRSYNRRVIVSDLIVVTFDSEEQAREARAAIKRLQKDELVKLEDAAVVTKDASGKLHIKNEIEHSVGVGAGVGGMLGLLFNAVLPGLGIVVGAATGALIGKLTQRGAEQKFVKETAESLQPGQSALFLVVNFASPAAIREIFEPYSGTIVHTTLDPEVEQQLRRSLQ